MPSAHRITASDVLEAAAQRCPQASEELLPLVYEELRLLARSRLQKVPPGQTLQPTALVHEAYLRVADGEERGWDSRGHFFAATAQAMRDILVECARRKSTLKRGKAFQRISSENAEPAFLPPSDDVLAIDEAVRRLEADDPRKGRIVNLRYFARLTTAETATALGVSIGTVEREWRYIRAWLQRELTRERPA